MILCADATKMPLENGSVSLICTSPPYDLGKDYEAAEPDERSYQEYRFFTRQWLKEAYHVLANDGRLCLNICLDKNKGGRIPLGPEVLQIAMYEAGFQYHGSIIWDDMGVSRRCQWGSWMSASSPATIACCEVVYVLYKKRWKRIEKGISDITADEFKHWTLARWRFNGESKKRVGHPAPFPVELPLRCLKLFSYVGDTVLDPFSGSGTTGVAATRCGRKYIGMDISEEYCQLAEKRIKTAEEALFEEGLARMKASQASLQSV